MKDSLTPPAAWSPPPQRPLSHPTWCRQCPDRHPVTPGRTDDGTLDVTHTVTVTSGKWGEVRIEQWDDPVEQPAPGDVHIQTDLWDELEPDEALAIAKALEHAARCLIAIRYAETGGFHQPSLTAGHSQTVVVR